MTRLKPMNATMLAARLAAQAAVLVDIREADEFARLHVAGAHSMPLSQLGAAHVRLDPARDVVFTCRSGMRTAANCAQLADAVAPGRTAFVLEGGIDGWAAAGLPLNRNTNAPLEMNRQVMIAAGLLVLAGVLLGALVAPAWFGLAGFVGAGLTFAGISGFCGMARLLALAPWNRAASA